MDFNLNFETYSDSISSKVCKSLNIEHHLDLKSFNGHFLHGVDIKFDFGKETIGYQMRQLGSILIEFNDQSIDACKVIKMALVYFVAVSEIGLKPTFLDLKLQKDENERYEFEALQSIRKEFGNNNPYIEKL